jgi:hypothetical protein
MSVVGQTRVLPEELPVTAERLRPIGRRPTLRASFTVTRRMHADVGRMRARVDLSGLPGNPLDRAADRAE